MSSEPRLIRSSFSPARWLTNRHAQTVYAALPWAYRYRPEMRREILDLPDGDATAVDWLASSTQPPGSQPLLVILHGIEGSSKSAYARMLIQAAETLDWRCCVLHFRDCGKYRNRLPRRYHAGQTGDIRYFLASLKAAGQTGPVLAAGYSLGGNVLLKYLGEVADETPLAAAAAICVPLDLYLCSEALNQGISNIYQRYLINRMKKAIRQKFDCHTAAFDWNRAMRASTFAEFDDAVTAPLHGFAGMNDYYERCSARHYLKTVTRPTLIVNALDDPFMMPDVIPSRDRLSPSITLEISNGGGHVGFIEGGTPWNPRYYLPRRIIEFLAPHAPAPSEIAVKRLRRLSSTGGHGPGGLPRAP